MMKMMKVKDKRFWTISWEENMLRKRKDGFVKEVNYYMNHRCHYI